MQQQTMRIMKRAITKAFETQEHDYGEFSRVIGITIKKQ